MKYPLKIMIMFVFGFALAAPGAPRAATPPIHGIEIDANVPATAAPDIAAAGLNTAVIHYAPYRKPDDAAIIKHLSEWRAAARSLDMNVYVSIDTGPPVDAVSDTATVKFRPAAADDGYPMTHKPAPASIDFWRTAIFPKIDLLAGLSEKETIRGVFVNLDGHVPVSYDLETFTEFLKLKKPDTDAAAIGAQQRKSFLAGEALLTAYEKYQEDAAYNLFKDYIHSLKQAHPNFEIHLTAGGDTPLHRAFKKALAEEQPGTRMILHEMKTAADAGKAVADGFTSVPELSVRDFTPDEMGVMLAGLDLWNTGFVISDAGALWSNFGDIDVSAWPLGLAKEYLDTAAASRQNADAQRDQNLQMLARLSSRVTVEHSGAPRIALVYSAYRGYMFRDVFDILLGAAGIPYEKFENSKLDGFVQNMDKFDAVIMAPGFNASKSKKFRPYAKDILEFVRQGGALFILDATIPAHVDWLGAADPELALVVEQKDGLSQQWINDSFKMLSYPNRITKLPIGKHHFSEAAAGWRHLARDNEGKPYVVQRMYGGGMIVALAYIEPPQEFIINAWEYMLKVQDKFDIMPDPHTPPMLNGHNEIGFVLKTVGPERNLKVTARTIDQSGSLQTAEVSVKLSAESGARFKVPLNAGDVHSMAFLQREAELYRMTLTFSDAGSGRVERRESFTFLSPNIYEIVTEKSYYTNEEIAIVRVACMSTYECAIVPRTVFLVDNDGNRFLDAKKVSTENGFSFYELQIGKLAPGNYMLYWLDMTYTKIVFSSKAHCVGCAPLIKLPPNPAGVETKLLNFRGGLLEVNGKPYFPLGIYSIPPENMDELAAAGVNGMIYYGNTTEAESDINKAVDGKGILFAAYPFYPHSRIHSDDRAVLRAELEAKAQNSNMFMWYLADEPELFGQSPELIGEVYEFVKSEDPYRPQALVMMNPNEFSRYAGTTDIFMFDRYPTPAGALDTVGQYARRSVAAVYGKKPVFAIPQAFSWAVWNGSYQEGDEHRPNYIEMRSSLVQCIAADVKGIIYWAFTASRYDMRKFPAHVEAFKKLMTEFSGLLDVMMQPNAYPEISVNPDFMGIDWGVKIYGGKMYIFSYNGDPSLRESVTFTLPSEYEGGTVEVYNENRAVPMQGRAFTDTFTAHAAHIYVVAAR